MTRREFMTLLGGATAWPLAARAQGSTVPIIGFVHLGSSIGFSYTASAFREGLQQFGYTEGHNVAIEYRWANNEPDRLRELVADLVRRQVAVIIACAGPLPGLAAKTATSTIPIVVVLGTDPVRSGLVASLNRPGGNVTGVYFLTRELVPKRFDLVRDLVPQVTTVAYLADDQRTETAQETMRDMLAAAGPLGRQLAVVEARSDRDFEPAFATFIERQAGALVVGPSPLFDSHRDKLIALAAHHKLPAIYQDREYASDGGLMSYGASFREAFRLGGRYVAQILKGVKAAELPVEQSSRFELVINMKTAKTLESRRSADASHPRRRADRIATAIAASAHAGLWLKASLRCDAPVWSLSEVKRTCRQGRYCQ